MNKNDRTGEIRTMKNGMKCTIIRYGTKRDIDVQFEDSYTSYNVEYGNFKKGTIKNPYVTKVYGVGILDKEADKEIYRRWMGMLKRCYSKNELKKCPTYVECSICEKWLLYSNFEKWYKKNYYEIENEIMELDKDILIKGNKIYSPETCLFVPHRINSLFTKSNKARGLYPIGVTFHKRHNKYNSKLNIKGNRVSLGYFKTIEEAFESYKEAKEEYIKQIADEYKDKILGKLYDAMYEWKVEITD